VISTCGSPTKPTSLQYHWIQPSILQDPTRGLSGEVPITIQLSMGFSDVCIAKPMWEYDGIIQRYS